jgi:hypothetical protein
MKKKNVRKGFFTIGLAHVNREVVNGVSCHVSQAVQLVYAII